MFAVQCAQFFGMAVHWCSDGAADGSMDPKAHSSSTTGDWQQIALTVALAAALLWLHWLLLFSVRD